MAFASSNDLGEKALEDAVGRAIAFAKIDDGRSQQRPARRQGRRPRSPASTTRAIAQVPMEEKIELAKRLEKPWP